MFNVLGEVGELEKVTIKDLSSVSIESEFLVCVWTALPDKSILSSTEWREKKKHTGVNHLLALLAFTRR